MHILYTDKFLANTNKTLNFHKEIRQDVVLSCALVFEGDTMVEYQQDLFQDFLSQLVDTLSNEDVELSTCKKAFEKGLQDINLKLQVFCEKMGDDKDFPIHGSIQLLFNTDYLSSFIGSSGLVILRKERLHYMLTNKREDTKKIDQFSEMVEGEVKIGDTLIACGFPVETYLDKDDILTIIGTTKTDSGESLLTGFLDVLQVRLGEDEIRYMTKMEIESPMVYTQKKIRNRLDGPYKRAVSALGGLERFQGTMLYGLLGLVVALLLYGIIQSFQQANNATFVNEEGGVVVDVTIEDIQRDIGRFQKIDPSSDQKIKKYNDIVSKLDLLDSNNKWTFDVAELRKILESEYYEGFNIVLANTDPFYKERVYEFTQQEKNTFGQLKHLFFKDSLIVAGTDGVLLGAINDQLRGILISSGIDQKINTCGFNLLRNGLYCATDTNQLFNIVKSGLQPVTTDSGAFPSSIVGLGRFASSNMYVLTEDPTLTINRTNIVKYKNKLGSQETFGESTQYVLNEGEGSAFAGSGLASFAIDGTFLTRSKSEKKLYQMRRLPNSANNLEYREVKLLGGDTVEPYSENTKIIADVDSRYVYLFDKDNSSFTVYRSTPYKTNDAFTYTYELSYFFRIKFGLPDVDIVDVFVQEGEKSSLLVLSDDAIYKMPLHEYIEKYFEKDSEE